MDDRSLGYKINRELKKWTELEEALKEGGLDDIETIVDTCDGETELVEALAMIQEKRLDNSMMVVGIDQALANLKARKDRLNKTNETWQNYILQVMERTGLKEVSSPLFLITKKRTAASLVVVNEGKLPSRYFKVPEPTLDRATLTKDLKELKDGEHIEGAEMSNGGITLQVRTR